MMTIRNNQTQAFIYINRERNREGKGKPKIRSDILTTLIFLLFLRLTKIFDS